MYATLEQVTDLKLKVKELFLNSYKSAEALLLGPANIRGGSPAVARLLAESNASPMVVAPTFWGVGIAEVGGSPVVKCLVEHTASVDVTVMADMLGTDPSKLLVQECPPIRVMATPGDSIGHYRITAGTLGAYVRRAQDDSKLFVLSNNHVLANVDRANLGDPILQPGPYDGGQLPAFALLADFEPVYRPAGQRLMDAAIAMVAAPQNEQHLQAPYGKVNSTMLARDGLQVQKVGRTTGHTHGNVKATLVDIRVDFNGTILDFEDQIEIQASSNSPFSQGGDSGSLIVTTLAPCKAVGLLFAGNGISTFANPIEPVLNRFQLTFV
jgi:hypothetical protein